MCISLIWHLSYLDHCHHNITNMLPSCSCGDWMRLILRGCETFQNLTRSQLQSVLRQKLTPDPHWIENLGKQARITTYRLTVTYRDLPWLTPPCESYFAAPTRTWRSAQKSQLKDLAICALDVFLPTVPRRKTSPNLYQIQLGDIRHNFFKHLHLGTWCIFFMSVATWACKPGTLQHLYKCLAWIAKSEFCQIKKAIKNIQ